MITDASTLEHESRLDADLCIVGAGAAGIAIALQFLYSPLRVLVLESGRARPDAVTQSLYAGTVADAALHPPTDTYRVRRFGGSTTLWGGRCIPLDPIDFARRDWIAGSGWPIAPDDIAPYYPAANAICEAGAFDYDARSAVPGGMRPLVAGFAPPHFDADGIERFSLPTNFAARYAHRLARSESVRVLLGANVTDIVTDAGGSTVESLTLRTLDTRRLTVAATRVVLALGGLETPRLLLASRSVHANGIGNARDLVGRHYMAHVAGTSGRLRLAVPRGFVTNGYEVAEDGTYLRRRLRLTDAAQERHGTGNAVLRLHFPHIPDPSHGSGVLSGLYFARFLLPYEYRKRLATRGGGLRHHLAHLANVARDPFSAVAFAANMLLKRKLAARKFPSVIVRPPGNVFSLDYHGEQEPNPASRITLGRDRDALGLPRLHVDWRHTDTDLRTATTTFRLLAEDIATWGRGHLDWTPEQVAHDVLREGAYGGHHLGTARMAHSPRTGVVDPDLKVHGLNNLWIAGGAVFPTSGQANPTLTIVALSLRLADHLRRDAGTAPPNVASGASGEAAGASRGA
ncbi:GMC oxidoreductase [Roseomonas sp. CCTCC AB2023176]|uniref:GMC oxidoreductase n=1 Tax=Roseomonas sp. CCTCC AB2023176 TaxID=3342640 RepID=UPI0035DB7692